MKNQKCIIVSAFPACGKSTCFNENSIYSETYNSKDKSRRIKILDSDSSQFSWEKDELGNNTKVRNVNFPANYIQHIKDNMLTQDIIFVSSHAEVREALHANDIPFILIYPNRNEKEEWKRRFEERGNDSNFINFIMNNWDTFMDQMENDPTTEKICFTTDDIITVDKLIK